MAIPSKFYFPQLDGLRFIAFFLVFIHHFPPGAVYFTEGTILYFITLKAATYGWIGVDIFLCLSSFLLTSLLIMEHQNTGSVSIKQFFIRRALRIWPLYYLLIILGFVIFPCLKFISPSFHSAHHGLLVKQHFFPFAIFMGNFSYAYFTDSLTASIGPLWTVSLEEQFYLFWPILLFILLPRDKKWFFCTLGSIVIFSMIVRLYILKNNIPYPTVWVFTLARLDPFALGAILSHIHLNPKFKARPLIALGLAIILFKLAICCSTGIGAKNTFWQLLAVDVASCLLIYSALHSSRLGKILSIKPLRWLGKISFGLYMFHAIVIAAMTSYVIPYLGHKQLSEYSFFVWVLVFLAGLLVTILCATISYYGFEKHFLKLKHRYTLVASRPI